MNSLWDIRIFLGLVPKESPCILYLHTKQCAQLKFRWYNPNTKCPMYCTSERCGSIAHKACIRWDNPRQLRGLRNTIKETPCQKQNCSERTARLDRWCNSTKFTPHCDPQLLIRTFSTSMCSVFNKINEKQYIIIWTYYAWYKVEIRWLCSKEASSTWMSTVMSDTAARSIFPIYAKISNTLFSLFKF